MSSPRKKHKSHARPKLTKHDRQRSLSLPDVSKAILSSSESSARVPVLKLSQAILDDDLFSPRSESLDSDCSGGRSVRTDSPKASSETYYSPRTNAFGSKSARARSNSVYKETFSSPRPQSARSTQSDSGVSGASSPRISMPKKSNRFRPSSPTSTSSKFFRLFSPRKSYKHEENEYPFASTLPLDSFSLNALHASFFKAMHAGSLSLTATQLYTAVDGSQYELFNLGKSYLGIHDFILLDYTNQIGCGHHAAVFKAYNTRTGETLAAKCYYNNVASDRLETEANTAAVMGRFCKRSISRRLPQGYSLVSGKSNTKSKDFSGDVLFFQYLGESDLINLLYNTEDTKLKSESDFYRSKKKILWIDRLYLIDAVLREVAELHVRGLSHSNICTEAFRISESVDGVDAHLLGLGSAKLAENRAAEFFRDYYALGIVLLDIASDKNFLCDLSQHKGLSKKENDFGGLQPQAMINYFDDFFREGGVAPLNARMQHSVDLDEYTSHYLDVVHHIKALAEQLITPDSQNRQQVDYLADLIAGNQQLIDNFHKDYARFHLFFEVRAELKQAGIELSQPYSRKNQ